MYVTEQLKFLQVSLLPPVKINGFRYISKKKNNCINITVISSIIMKKEIPEEKTAFLRQ
jgi:hypothetical protein